MTPRSDIQSDVLLLIARVLLLILFGYFGVTYVVGHNDFVQYLRSVDAPLPELAAIVSNIIELGGTIVLLLGIWTRPVAVIFAVYTLGTAFVGHAYWTLTGAAEHHAQFVHFFKNVSIAAAFLFLYVTGPGRFSLDARRSAVAP